MQVQGLGTTDAGQDDPLRVVPAAQDQGDLVGVRPRAVDWGVLMATGGRIVAQGTPQELMDSSDPEVRQFVRGEPDGPVKFHYPAPELSEDFGVTT